jgi:hypothetical protein
MHKIKFTLNRQSVLIIISNGINRTIKNRDDQFIESMGEGWRPSV